MTKRARRNHTPAFKAKVALAAIKGEKCQTALNSFQVTACKSFQLIGPQGRTDCLVAAPNGCVGVGRHWDGHPRSCPTMDARPVLDPRSGRARPPLSFPGLSASRFERTEGMEEGTGLCPSKRCSPRLQLTTYAADAISA